MISKLNKSCFPTHQEVRFCNDESTGLKEFIAIHDTTFGPAVGGTRMMAYKTEEEALQDVLRLSRAMTYKAVAAGLKFGGGKAVIIGDPERDKTEKLMRAFGRFIATFEGSFITGDDIGTTAADWETVGQETRFVPQANVGAATDSALTELTAIGVFHGI